MAAHRTPAALPLYREAARLSKIAKAKGRAAEGSDDPEKHRSAENAYGQAATAWWSVTRDVSDRAEVDRLMAEGRTYSKISDAHKARREQIGQERWRAKHDTWSGRETLHEAHPPTTINVLDVHGGFTAITNTRSMRSGFGEQTVWRPGALLKKTTIGHLISVDRKSFYQNNNNVTKARYKVAGYNYPVAVWFDNETGRRIA